MGASPSHESHSSSQSVGRELVLERRELALERRERELERRERELDRREAEKEKELEKGAGGLKHVRCNSREKLPPNLSESESKPPATP